MFRTSLTRSARPLARCLRSSTANHNVSRTAAAGVVRNYASASTMPFDWEDPLRTKDLLTEDEIAIMDTAERYCQERLLPRVLRKFWSGERALWL